MNAISSLISIIISTLSTLIALVMLFMTRQDMNRRERKDADRFISDAYQNFQLLHLSLLKDEDALKQLASDRGKNGNEVKVDSISSLWINQALYLFQLYEGGHLSEEVWLRFKVDIRGLMRRRSILKRWHEVGKFYPKGFQTFIDTIHLT